MILDKTAKIEESRDSEMLPFSVFFVDIMYRKKYLVKSEFYV